MLMAAWCSAREDFPSIRSQAPDSTSPNLVVEDELIIERESHTARTSQLPSRSELTLRRCRNAFTYTSEYWRELQPLNQASASVLLSPKVTTRDIALSASRNRCVTPSKPLRSE